MTKRQVAKPKVWRAWCAFYEDATGPVVSSVIHGALTPFVRLAFTTRAHARLMNPGKRIARVEIREVPRKKRRTAK